MSDWYGVFIYTALAVLLIYHIVQQHLANRKENKRDAKMLELEDRIGDCEWALQNWMDAIETVKQRSGESQSTIKEETKP